MIQALIFDFDGLILDTETPEFRSWQNIYREYGFEFPSERWGSIVGGNGHSDFDAADHLSLLTQGRLDSDSLRTRNRLESDEIILAQGTLPGVSDYIHDAKRLRLKLAIASSSDAAWIHRHGTRLGVLEYFDDIVTRDDVGIGRTKPNPDLFLLTLSRLKVPKEAAIVFEDSPNGVKAANNAGIFVVAIPNGVTSLLSLEEADLTLKSMSDLPLSQLLDKIESKHGRAR